MSQLPTHDHMDLYGPARNSAELVALLAAVWDACIPWVDVIASPYGESASDAQSFAAALEGAGRPVSTAIGCWFRGEGREVFFASSRGSNARSLDQGSDFQQTQLSITPGRDAQVGAHLLQSVGVASNAWFGWFTPEPEAVLLMLKHGGYTSDARWKHAGPRYERLRQSTVLTTLPVFNLEHWRRAHLPPRIGWCNYWSARTCELLGFPDPARDAELMLTSTKLANGAWLVRLTDTPLDLSVD